MPRICISTSPFGYTFWLVLNSEWRASLSWRSHPPSSLICGRLGAFCLQARQSCILCVILACAICHGNHLYFLTFMRSARKHAWAWACLIHLGIVSPPGRDLVNSVRFAYCFYVVRIVHNNTHTLLNIMVLFVVWLQVHMFSRCSHVVMFLSHL